MHSCPYCGCPDVYLADTDGGGRTVACPSCGMSGPESVDGDDEEAARGPCWEQNFEYELIDVMATCKRALLGDHKHIYGKSPDEQIKRW